MEDIHHMLILLCSLSVQDIWLLYANKNLENFAEKFTQCFKTFEKKFL